MPNVTAQSLSTSDIRFAMTSFPGFSASTMPQSTEAAAGATAAVTSDVADVSDWTTSVVDVTASTGSDRAWSRWTTAAAESNATVATYSPLSTNSSTEDSPGSSSSAADVAYQRLMNLGVIVVVYAVVLVAMMVLACRRRRTGDEYGRLVDWTDLEVCGGDDDEVDDSAALQRYWDTRRDMAERQRLLDSLRVDNISSVAAGHLIDRLPEHVV